MAFFYKSMSTSELIEWLEAKGLCSKDCEALREEEFTGETFLLLKEEDISELDIDMVDKMRELLLEAKDDVKDDGDYCISSVSNLCACPPYNEEVVGPSCSEACGKGAAAYAKAIWDVELLKVFVMNREVLENWSYEQKQITVATILEWANAWNPDGKGTAPIFAEERNAKHAHIRIQLSNSETCWSVVGKCAEKIFNHSKPTMLLNLSDDHRQNDAEKKSLVIHEFGHALGLGHEHQRSDFWKAVGKYFDMDQIESEKDVGPIRRSRSDVMVATFSRNYFEELDGLCALSPYDPDSIMHYTFAFDWLKKELRDKIGHPKRAHKYKGFTSDAQKIFKTLFKKTTISTNPSPSDLDCVEKLYKEQ